MSRKLTAAERRLSRLELLAKLDADVQRCQGRVIQWAKRLDDARGKLARARRRAGRPDAPSPPPTQNGVRDGLPF